MSKYTPAGRVSVNRKIRTWARSQVADPIAATSVATETRNVQACRGTAGSSGQGRHQPIYGFGVQIDCGTDLGHLPVDRRGSGLGQLIHDLRQ